VETRYNRQELIPNWNQALLQKRRVLVVGGGTLGNEIIKNLVLMGLGEITVIDNEDVATVNLNRSVLFRHEDIGKPKAEVIAQRSRELNPDCEIIPLIKDVVYDVGILEFGEYACVILAVDNNKARMHVNRCCCFNETPIINTGTRSYSGQAYVHLCKVDSSCVECDWSASTYAEVEKEFACLREGLGVSTSPVPMVISAAAIIGGIASQECVRLLQDLNEGKGNSIGFEISYDGESHSFAKLLVPANPSCNGHYRKRFRDCRILEVNLSVDEPIQKAIEKISTELKTDRMELSTVDIDNYRQIVYGANCRACGQIVHVPPGLLGRFRRRVCPGCGEPEVVAISPTTTLKGTSTFRDVGIPKNDLIRVDYVDSSGIEHVGEEYVIAR
jgi:adenylyltransferase/sulfurtransferase